MTRILSALTAYMAAGTFAWMLCGGTASSCITLGLLTLAVAVSTVGAAVAHLGRVIGGQR